MLARLLNISFLIFLVIILAWLLTYVDNRQILLTSQPISSDKGQNGLHKFRSWIDKAGYESASLTTSYQTLQQDDNRHLLFATLPAALPTSQQELEYLQTWVASGNTLVLMLALDDKPHWHNQQNRFTVENYLNSFRLSLIQLDTPQTADKEETKQGVLIAQLPSRLTYQVKRVESNSDQQSHTWQLLGKESVNSALILLRDQTSLSPAAWLSQYGKGQIFIFTHSNLFSNGQIAKADNLTLAKNILRHSLPGKAIIYFDDVHHIITPTRNSANVLMHPLLLLAGGVLVYSLLIRLLRRVETNKAKTAMSLQKFIRDTSIHDAHTLSDREVAVKYAAHFFNAIRATYGLTMNSQPTWDILKSRNKHTRLVTKAERTYQRVLAAKKFNLHKFIDRLEKLRI